MDGNGSLLKRTNFDQCMAGLTCSLCCMTEQQDRRQTYAKAGIKYRHKSSKKQARQGQ